MLSKYWKINEKRDQMFEFLKIRGPKLFKKFRIIELSTTCINYYYKLK
jgi:hypothetical protein